MLVWWLIASASGFLCLSFWGGDRRAAFGVGYLLKDRLYVMANGMKESASSSFCFTFLKMVACFWKVVVLCHPFDRSLLSLVFPPLACLPWGRIGWSSWGGDSKTWLKEVSIVSLFSVMLMGTPGIGRAGFLKVSGKGKRPLVDFLLLLLFL